MPADTPLPAAPPHSAQLAAEKSHGSLGFALDFGPLLVFFLGFKFGGIIIGTAAFMVAITLALIVSKWKLGKVSPMLWLSAIMVLFFGSLTIYFNDQKFIQIKPTIIYSFFAILLFGGLMRGKPLLKYLLQSAYDGLSEEGWMKLSRNWALFFVAMALANEAMRALFSFDTWLTIKLWGLTIVSFLFAAANIPMLMRHGLVLDKRVVADEVVKGDPPQG
jgi:intracellular septation protein